MQMTYFSLRGWHQEQIGITKIKNAVGFTRQEVVLASDTAPNGPNTRMS